MEEVWVLWGLVGGGLVYLCMGLVIPMFFEKNSALLVRLYTVYSMMGSYYVCAMCVYNIAVYLSDCVTGSGDSGGVPFLLAMTPTQTYPLVFCFLDYFMDIGLFIRGVDSDLLDKETILYHHTLSILGVAFELYYWMGGGMMMCLLLDTFEVALSLLENVAFDFFPTLVTPDRRRKFLMLTWVFWIATRLVWYTLVSVWSVVTFFGVYFLGWGSTPHPTAMGVFCIMVLVWVVYACVEHFTVFWDYMEADSRYLHDTLRLLHIPIPARFTGRHPPAKAKLQLVTTFKTTASTLTSTSTSTPASTSALASASTHDNDKKTN
eukprot:TRINITY_DN5927_c0_g1_i1.p1 TRINITY_DN5927_c0_g1~~TRINITY_DN5927_c0_g1_i1.p1  ORF type:complete len:320 (-),score=45.51 TRINITY_DN5927_c0_g1_i1:676-1635(-)